MRAPLANLTVRFGPPNDGRPGRGSGDYGRAPVEFRDVL
jgi:hypothetical protein